METILSYFQRSFLGCASFKVGELLKSKEQLLSLSLR
jgi:inositol polyphosphate-4-phosphatase